MRSVVSSPPPDDTEEKKVGNYLNIDYAVGSKIRYYLIRSHSQSSVGR